MQCNATIHPSLYENIILCLTCQRITIRVAFLHTDVKFSVPCSISFAIGLSQRTRHDVYIHHLGWVFVISERIETNIKMICTVYKVKVDITTVRCAKAFAILNHRTDLGFCDADEVRLMKGVISKAPGVDVGCLGLDLCALKTTKFQCSKGTTRFFR